MNEPETSTILRAVGYRRVSMKDQVNGFSLDAQEGNISRYIESRGWQLIEIYVDAGISAKKGSHRPAFERLLRDASEKKFDVVVVDKIDRFYRHLSGLLSTLDLLNNYGISFVSVQEQLDFTTPWGKLMLTVLGTLAEIYIDNLRQETKKGKRQRARNGLWLGAIPYGYCNGLCANCTDPNGQGYCPDFGKPNKGTGKKMVLHPIESEIVKMVFDWYANGQESNSSISTKLNEMIIELPNGETIQPRQKGHPGRTNPGPFTRDIIRDMLLRVAYLGKVPYQGIADDGRHRKRKPPIEVYEACHPAIVSEDVYNKAQEIRQLRWRNPLFKKHKTANIFPLTGILRCGFCGGNMRGASKTGGVSYYIDSNQQDHVCKCEQRMVRVEVIEEQIVTWIRNLAYQTSDEMTSSQDLLKEYEERYTRYKDLFLDGDISREEYSSEKMRWETAKQRLHAAEIHARMTFVHTIQPQLEQWEELPLIKRKKLLRLVLEAAYLQKNAFVAAQPTFAFQPMVNHRTCNCGEGGIRTHG